jgi:SAM-dependent methyltransferase
MLQQTDDTIMPINALYTDLSGYYDLLCADIDYRAQSNSVRRLHQLFGNNGKAHLDLGCGTGPHVRHFIDFGYTSHGLDINQPMLDIATLRCPEAQFHLLDMSTFTVEEPVDLMTCFLYSIHYNDGIEKLSSCVASVHRALTTGGVFCFNAVDKNKIDNHSFIKHTVQQDNHSFTFQSGWHYCGGGNKQSLHLGIEKTNSEGTQRWKDEHAMVAVDFNTLTDMLTPDFDVHIFECDYEKITPCNEKSGNAIFVCVKR